MPGYLKKYLLILLPAAYLISCGRTPAGNVTETGRTPVINPDYSGVTVPYNIAPLNFKIAEPATYYIARFSCGSGIQFDVKSSNGSITIPENKWKKMLEASKGSGYSMEIFLRDKSGSWSKFSPITNIVASEPVDPYVTYRILYPGYESWKEISINQRSLESFREKPIIENSIADENCINCHSYNNTGNNRDFMFHMRGSMGGTYFLTGNGFRKVNLKTKEMANGAVYPRWHPSGRFVAFSSNRIVQQFHSALSKKVEVSDLESSLVLYDVDKNEIMNIDLPGKENFMDTYPEWSPDGKYLYFCRAPEPGKIFIYDQIRYDLYRIAFDPEARKFGEAELIFNASAIGKSVSFPRISPDGRFLILTLHNYGSFPIWHKEADLYSIDLNSRDTTRLALNSDYTDSYHSWSSNSRWLIFSSKRLDGLTAGLYISYIGQDGNSGKPFILPQKDPEFYSGFLKTFNLPEFSTFKIDVRPGILRRSVSGKAIQAKWAGQ